MRILLVEPPFQHLKGIRAHYFPIGLGYLAAVLRAHGHDALIHNAELMARAAVPELPGDGHTAVRFTQHRRYREALAAETHAAWTEVRDVLREFQPDLVGITVRSAKLPSALRIARIVKSVAPQCRVVVGGPHPTVAPEECAAQADVDFVIRGEGEQTIAELCDALENGGELEAVAGLTFRREGQVIETPPRPLIQDLDALPFPARSAVSRPGRYDARMMGDVVTGRGCPFHCGYCSAASTWTRRVRYRSVANVLDELEAIRREFGTRDVSFWDDSFTVNRRRVIELCRGMRERRLGMRWSCTTRVDLLDDEMLGEMRRAGCVNIALGIETGSERMLKLIDKGIDLTKIRDAVAMTRRHGIRINAYFMVGFPDETVADVQATIDLMRQVPASNLCLSIFTPYPGSALFERARELQLIPAQVAWEDFDHQSPHNFFVKNIARAEFDALVAEMIEIADAQSRPSLAHRLEFLRSDGRYFLEHPGALLGKVAARLRRAS